MAASVDAAAIASAKQRSLMSGASWLVELERAASLEPEAWLEGLGAATHWPTWRTARLMAGRPDFRVLPHIQCQQRQCVVVDDAAGPAFVFCDPLSEGLQAWADANLASGVSRALVHPADLEVFLARHTGAARVADAAADGSATTDSADAVEVWSITHADEQGEVVSRVNGYLHDGIQQFASDIHLRSHAQGLDVKYRLDGVLGLADRVSGRDLAERMISRVKVMANLDIAEQRIPQDGRFRARLGESVVDFRVSIMPSAHGEDAVLRLLDRRALARENGPLKLDQLGLDPAAIAAFRRMAGHPYGMVLVTGPTGSGKTTTLYAAINEINTGRDNIVTIEDPVEYQLGGVLQIPVNEKKGLTFARGLRSMLRHDPDKIMVGEIRDEETAQIAVQAALTGHVVFTTVHANNVFDVLGRFLHMGVDPYGLASALVGIWAQRLVRMNCEACSQEVNPLDVELTDSGLRREDVAGYRFRAGAGCDRCHQTGYLGRRAVAEYVHFSDALREMVVARQSAAQLKAEALRNGMRPLRQAALQVVAEGRTTLQEINRVTFAS